MIKINYSNAYEREIIKKRKEITKSVRQVVFRIDCTREKLSGEKITMERNFWIQFSRCVTFDKKKIKKMIQVARNERLDRANNCFNCSHTRCGVFVNVEQTRFAWPSRNIARSAFPGLRVKNISDNFKRFRPANLKGMPIGSLCARPIFPIFFAQTSRLPIPPKNHHYSASLRLINPRRSNRLFIAGEGKPSFSLSLLIPICLKIEIPISSKGDLKKLPRKLDFPREKMFLELDEQNPDGRLKGEKWRSNRFHLVRVAVESCILASHEIARLVI